MKWFTIKRTARGKEVITGLFKYARACEVGTEPMILLSDGALMWAKVTKEGARTMFKVADAVDEEVAKEVEKNHQMSLGREDRYE